MHRVSHAASQLTASWPSVPPLVCSLLLGRSPQYGFADFGRRCHVGETVHSLISNKVVLLWSSQRAGTGACEEKVRRRGRGGKASLPFVIGKQVRAFMSNYRPVPLVDRDSAPFWEGVRNHKFLLMECSECEHVFFPPRIVCPECWSSELSWKEARGSGVIHSFTTVEAGATSGFSSLTPYTVALITLDEGCRVFGMLRDAVSRGLPSIGGEVTCEFETDPESGVVFPVWALGENGGAS